MTGYFSVQGQNSGGCGPVPNFRQVFGSQGQAEGLYGLAENGVVDLGVSGKEGDDDGNADTAADISHQAVHRRPFGTKMGGKCRKSAGTERHKDKAKTKPLDDSGPDEDRNGYLGGEVAHDKK